MVENGCTYGFLRSFLAHDIVIYSILEVSRIEPGYTEAGFREHRTSPSVGCGIITAIETGIQVRVRSGGGIPARCRYVPIWVAFGTGEAPPG